MDFESDDPVPGVPPLADDATATAIASFSLSERSCITTPRVSKTMGDNKKSSTKRVTTISPRPFHLPLQLQRGLYPPPPTLPSTYPLKIPHIRTSLRQPFLTPPRHRCPCAIATRIDHPMIQVQSTLESSPPHPFHISRILS